MSFQLCKVYNLRTGPVCAMQAARLWLKHKQVNARVHTQCDWAQTGGQSPKQPQSLENEREI